MAATLALSLLLAACEHARPARPRPAGNGKIAFIREDPDHPNDPRRSGIFLIDPHDGTTTQLAPLPVADNRGLAWSADGTRLAVLLSARSRIGIVSADGGGVTVLTNGQGFPPGTSFSRPTWSPDGKRIAVTAEYVPAGVKCVELDCLRFIRSDLYVLSVDGGAAKRLTRDDLLVGGPAWSPDGERIAVAAVPAPHPEGPPPGRSQVYVIGADGGPLRRLTSFALDPRQLAWSPDGERIAFQGAGGGIYVMDADGRDPRQITHSSEHSDPAWSPDGRKIVFTRTSGVGGEGIYVTDVDGTGDGKLTDGWAPAWQPVLIGPSN